ncbi:MAG: BatD family protein [Luteimonas sp.]|nr:BatD family protein [Luteimonas sp.]
MSTTRVAWCWLLCFALALPTQAQSGTRAWLDRDRIALGETATLNIETDQAAAQAPDFDALLPDFVVSNRSSSRSIELVNGERRTRVLFAVALRPRREGVATVPALRVGGESTQPLAITVTPRNAEPARAGAPVFIEGTPDSRDVFVQQSVGYVLRLYYATPLISGELDQPEPDGAAMQRVGSDLQYSREIDGRRYTVVERRFQLVPERSGTLTIPGARFNGQGVGGFFDDLLGDGRRALGADGAPQVLQVRPVPDGAPQPWLPLHALELRYVETPPSLRAGEAAAVVVEMTADGATASQLPDLQLPAIDGAQVFPDPPQVDETFERGRLRARVTRRFSLLPAQAGALRVRGPRQAWWDVAANTARTASLPDLLLDVAEGAAAQGGMVPLPAGSPRDSARPVSAIAGPWPWLAMAFALLWLGTLAWALHRRRPWPVRQVTGAPPPKDGIDPHASRPSLRELQRVLRTEDLGQVERVVLALASPPAPDLDALSRRLDDDAQRAAISRLQQARWAGADAGEARKALAAAFAQGPRWRVATVSADAAPPWLPPLYPDRRDS